jgi:hypothetical protein
MKELRKFLYQWNELVSLPIAFVLWYFSGDLLRMIDPTAATYDAGIFQIILFAVIGGLTIHAVAWLLIKITFPGVYGYLDNFLEKNLIGNDQQFSMTRWEKSKVVLWVFTLYLFLFVALLRVL